MSVQIGLDIGSAAVRAVQVRSARRGPASLQRIGQVPLPSGAVRDGEIFEQEPVVMALRTLWQTFGFRGRKVRVGVANQQVIVRQLDVPYLPEAELRRSLPLQVQGQLPIAVEQAVLDHYLLRNTENDAGLRMSQLLVVAAQRRMVDQMVDVLRAARLQPVALDLNAFALLRALADPAALPRGEAELLIDAGAAVTNLIVHEAGRPLFVRIVTAGGAAITESLVSALGVTADEAEHAKATIGMPRDQFAEAPDDHGQVIADRAEQFLEEIRGSMDYYHATPESVPLARAQLTGGAGQLPHLRERLEGVLRIPVAVGRPFERVRIGSVPLSGDELARAEPFLSVALGLAA
jgi:type IV pilus assembly protein PilM